MGAKITLIFEIKKQKKTKILIIKNKKNKKNYT